jgi:hypothetical protein
VKIKNPNYSQLEGRQGGPAATGLESPMGGRHIRRTSDTALTAMVVGRRPGAMLTKTSDHEPRTDDGLGREGSYSSVAATHDARPPAVVRGCAAAPHAADART